MNTGIEAATDAIVDQDGHLLIAPEDRPKGLEVLAFHRGKWRHVKWNGSDGWSLGYGKEFIRDADRKFAPLPAKPDDSDEFYSWKD